ncbi:MAG: DinB family protein [Cyclobacteriaceae bacterium]|nr:DinB family protein [Cyclobacteriaceae bacterium]
MKFSLEKSLEILESTPNVISAMLQNLSEDWTNHNEGGNTWTAKEVLAHLIICEETEWLTRTKIILSEAIEKKLTPIDLQAHFEIAEKNDLSFLLMKFRELRTKNTSELLSFNLQESDFAKTAMHPELGEVNLQHIISTWTTHDLSHIAQIARVIAKQYKDFIGGFRKYQRVLNQ